MIFPSTNQMTGQTGIPVRHRYDDYYSQLSAQLPARKQVENTNRYYNDMLDVEQRNQQATEGYYDNMYALNKEQAEAAEDARKKGLWLQGAGLGFAGANALNQYTDGGVEKAVRSIPSLFTDNTTEKLASMGTNLAGVDMAGGSGSGNLWESSGIGPAASGAWDVVSGGIGEAGSAVKDFATDYIADPLKKLGQGVSDAFTDVTGFVGGLFS